MRAEIVPINDDGRDWPDGAPVGVGVAVRLNTRVEYRHVLPEVVRHVLGVWEAAEAAVSGLLQDAPELLERDQIEWRNRLATEMCECMGTAWGGLTGLSGPELRPSAQRD